MFVLFSLLFFTTVLMVGCIRWYEWLGLCWVSIDTATVFCFGGACHNLSHFLFPGASIGGILSLAFLPRKKRVPRIMVLFSGGNSFGPIGLFGVYEAGPGLFREQQSPVPRRVSRTRLRCLCTTTDGARHYIPPPTFP